MTESNPLQLGVIGLGWAGSQALLAAEHVPQTQVVAAADLSRERREEAASQHNIPRVYRDCRRLLEDPRVEAVYVATGPTLHPRMAIDSLRAGKHVLVQKPHATRPVEILRMDRAAKKAGKTLQFCFYMRHDPTRRKLRQKLLGGAIGQIYHARVFVRFDLIPPMNRRNRWLHVDGLMGGALAQHASHDVDLAWWLMGCPRPVWAFAAKHSPHRRYRGPKGPAEDYLTGLVGFEDGQTIQVDATRWTHLPVSIGNLELYGTDGAVEGTTISQHLKGARRQFHTEQIKAPPDRRRGPRQACFFHEIEHFARAVAGRVPPDVNAAEAYMFMKILSGLYASARSNRRVTIRTE